LQQISKNEVFQNGKINTQFITNNKDQLFSKLPASIEVIAIASLYLLLLQHKTTQQFAQTSSDSFSPWLQHDNWRLDSSEPQHLSFTDAIGKKIVVDAMLTTNGYQLQIGDRKINVNGNISDDGTITIQADDIVINAKVIRQQQNLHIFYHGYFLLQIKGQETDANEDRVTIGKIIAPMPGTIVSLFVKDGQNVNKGQPLVILEAMKMEHTLLAPTAGIVKKVFFKSGDQVSEGVELIELTSLET
jgi:3-methylcrotonyl-CoA carboxylase alpha subunit